MQPSGGRKPRAISSAEASGLASGIRLAMNVSAMLGTEGIEIAERWTANQTFNKPHVLVITCFIIRLSKLRETLPASAA